MGCDCWCHAECALTGVVWPILNCVSHVNRTFQEDSHRVLAHRTVGRGRTDYNDGYSRFEDLRAGDRVELEFEYRDGRHIATEIELED